MKSSASAKTEATAEDCCWGAPAKVVRGYEGDDKQQRQKYSEGEEEGLKGIDLTKEDREGEECSTEISMGGTPSHATLPFVAAATAALVCEND